MSMRKKVQIVAMFAVGFLYVYPIHTAHRGVCAKTMHSITIVSIVRLSSLIRFGTTSNLTRKLLLSSLQLTAYRFKSIPSSASFPTRSNLTFYRGLCRSRLLVDDRSPRRRDLRVHASDAVSLQCGAAKGLRHDQGRDEDLQQLRAVIGVEASCLE